MTLPAVASASPGPGRFRWVVCGLLFFATANNYLDRQALGVLAPELIRYFGWTEADYADVVLWFQIGFALGFPLTGRFLDAVGTRWGFAIAVAVWSAASAGHGAISSLGSFKLARFILGLSQPSNMPAGVKVVAEWFPPAERALATGVFKGGANLGAVLVPVLVPWLFFAHGWRVAFVVIAASGFVWLGFWLWLYRAPTNRELAVAAEPSAPTGRVPWRVLLRQRETWAYMNFKFMTDAIWHWYLAMLPLFLSRKFGLSLAEFGPPLVAVYVIAYGGSIGGGWLSSHWISRGWDLTRARKTAMGICCAATVPVMLVTQLDHLWACIGLIGLAHAAHQGLTSNLFTAVSDIFPRQAVGTVVGLGGTAAQLGAALMTLASGWVLATHGDLTGLFFIAGSVYLVAFLIFHLLVPRLVPRTFSVTG
jgi:MFS transporter, ACS family, hexuronate transporter